MDQIPPPGNRDLYASFSRSGQDPIDQTAETTQGSLQGKKVNLLEAPNFPINFGPATHFPTSSFMDGVTAVLPKKMGDEKATPSIELKTESNNQDWSLEDAFALIPKQKISWIWMRIQFLEKFSLEEERTLDAIVYIFFIFIISYDKIKSFKKFYNDLKKSKLFSVCFIGNIHVDMTKINYEKIMPTIRKVCSAIEKDAVVQAYIRQNYPSFLNSLTRYSGILRSNNSEARQGAKKRKSGNDSATERP